jgi:hypothetical protein
MDRRRRVLLAEMFAGRDRLCAELARFDPASMLERVDDEWTRKDVVAHIGAWERRVVDLIERLRSGESPDDAMQTDELNARYHAAHRDLPLDLVLRSEEEAWRELLGVVEAAPVRELFDGRRFAWTDGDPLADWIRANSDRHYAEHLEQLTRPARD